MIEISKHEYGILLAILSKWSKHFFASGSRVKSTHQKYSDIELCYLEPIEKKILYNIQEALEESNLTCTVDIVDFQQASETFQNLIKDDLVKLPRAEIRKPKSDDEWQTYHDIRINELFSSIPNVVYDPNHPSITNENNHHFLFYLDEEPVGVLHIEIKSHAQAVIRDIAVVSDHQTKGYGAAVLSLAHNWLQERNIHKVNLHSRHEIVDFYKKFGYSEMKFEDEGGLPVPRVDMGRFL